MSATCRSDCIVFTPIEVEGDSIRFDVGFEGVLELVVRDRSGAVTVGLSVTPSSSRTESGGETAYTSKYWKATK
jgi:hypothetical protein